MHYVASTTYLSTCIPGCPCNCNGIIRCVLVLLVTIWPLCFEFLVLDSYFGVFRCFSQYYCRLSCRWSSSGSMAGPLQLQSPQNPNVWMAFAGPNTLIWLGLSTTIKRVLIRNSQSCLRCWMDLFSTNEHILGVVFLSCRILFSNRHRQATTSSSQKPELPHTYENHGTTRWWW